MCASQNTPVYINYQMYNGNDPIINRVLPLPKGIMWSNLVKIQYTERQLSCRNDHVVKNYIYSNGDLDL